MDMFINFELVILKAMNKISKHLFISTVFLSCFIFTRAQDVRTVSGVVTTFGSIPLNKVSINSVKSGNNVLSQADGTFSIKCAENDLLKVTASGFESRKVKIGKDLIKKIDLTYKDNVKNFNDAVSDGHISGDVLKKAIYDQEKKNAKDYSKYKSIYDLIASEVYNVRVNGTTVINRKLKSFDRNPAVLLVVDEKIVADISYVNPAYVKTIEFIDDVGTTAYGSMGANGVLKITLK